jgi:hypothetical protein
MHSILGSSKKSTFYLKVMNGEFSQTTPFFTSTGDEEPRPQSSRKRLLKVVETPLSSKSAKGR